MGRITIVLFSCFLFCIACGFEEAPESKGIKTSYYGVYNLSDEDKSLLTAGTVPVILTSEGDTLPSQGVDLNLDGTFDQVHFINANIATVSSVIALPKLYLTNLTTKTNIRFAKKENGVTTPLLKGERLKTTESAITNKNFQMEGPAWENDKVGFRNYFDARNGIDIFGKQVAGMALDTVGLRSSYHELHEWGMDILKVGTSLGAGAIALQINDTLYRIGPDAEGSYKLNYEGPVTSSFTLSFRGVKAAGRLYNVTHVVRIWAGAYGYESKVTVEGLQGDEKLVSGIVNLHSDTVYFEISNNSALLYTYDKQAFLGENLGMGLIIPKEHFVEHVEALPDAEGITSTYYAAMNFDDQNSCCFMFCAGWQLTATAFETKKGYREILLQEAGKFNN